MKRGTGDEPGTPLALLERKSRCQPRSPWFVARHARPALSAERLVPGRRERAYEVTRGTLGLLPASGAIEFSGLDPVRPRSVDVAPSCFESVREFVPASGIIAEVWTSMS